MIEFRCGARVRRLRPRKPGSRRRGQDASRTRSGSNSLATDPSIRFSFITANGVTLHCAEAGPDEGPLVVLLHGFPEFWFGWREYFRPLAAQGFRVAPDQRGYNLSSKPESPEAYRLEPCGRHLRPGRRPGRDRFHVVGHDWGAAVAWTMAGLAPRRLLSAAMLQAPIRRSGSTPCATIPTSGTGAATCQILRLPWLPK